MHIAKMKAIAILLCLGAARAADLDLDGHRDLFVTNGIWRRPNDLDYIKVEEEKAIA